MNTKRYDWEEVARELGHSLARDMWKDLYVTRELSTAAISRKLGVSQNTVRSELTSAGIPFRSRGGPNNTKISMTEEMAQAIAMKGMAAVAKELGIKYGTLYKRYVKYRGGPLRESLRRRQSGQDDLGTLGPVGGFDHAKNR